MTLGHKYPFLILLTALIAGILCGDHFNIPHTILYIGLASILLMCFVQFVPFLHTPKSLSDISLLTAIFICGITLTQREIINPDPTNTYHIRARCEEKLNHNNYILSGNGWKFYLSNFQLDTTYNIGDSLAFAGKIYLLKENSNIGEFSYNRYLKQKGVHFKIIPVTKIRKTGCSQNLISFFEELRRKLMTKTDKLFSDSTHTALVNALCLGYQNDLDNETQQLFRSTGTIHLLSVSGLHTGAIYLLILFFFKRFSISNKKTELLILPILWGYACLTGLSPSVVRAATILSFITFGKAFGKDYTPVNAIAASAFFTLIVRPLVLYSISFQLSYAAYLGIITLFPFLNRLPGKLPSVPAKLYASLCITLTAQLPTLPICAYYFHTINLNSFLANIIAVPLATILLYASTLLMLIPCIIGEKMAFFADYICNILFYTLKLFDSISINLYELYPSAGQVTGLYLCLLAICLFLLKRTRWLLYGSILSVTSLLIYSCLFNFYLTTRSEIVIFNIYKQTCILLNHNGYYTLLKNNTTNLQKINPYILKNKLRPLPPHTGLLSEFILLHDNKLQYKKQNIGIVDHNHLVIDHPAILIVTENIPPRKIFHTTSSDYPDKIILDGSNSHFLTDEWEKFCREKDVVFFKTTDIGSIALTLK